MKLVFIGIQGSGKGTQARLLEEKYDYKLFETGTALRNIAKEDSELGRTIKTIIEAGDQVSPEIVEDIMVDIIDNKSDGKNTIFDGFIRNVGNKESADKILGEYTVVLFRLSEEKARERLLGRMYNPETSQTFKAGTILDPETGEELQKRADDNEEAIEKRITLYVERALPLVTEYRKTGKLLEVNADQSIDDVFNQLQEKLELK